MSRINTEILKNVTGSGAPTCFAPPPPPPYNGKKSSKNIRCTDLICPQPESRKIKLRAYRYRVFCSGRHMI